MVRKDTTLKKQIDELKKQIKELKQKAAEFEANWKRALADYQNLEKRVKNERKIQVKVAAKDFLKSLLPVFDTLEEATKHINDEGLTITFKQLMNTLKTEGVERIKTEGVKFDPESMEAVDVVKTEKEGIVIKEVKPAYKFHGELLRPAQVIVGKKDVDKKKEEIAKEELQKGDYM